jgi:hypothetical protein
MPVDVCECCGGQIAWSWTEAFEKFGFNDGDGQIMTYVVRDVLTEAGFEVTDHHWGLHNVVIVSIVCPTRGELMPGDASGVQVGYDDPRDYLPADIIALLDRALPD